MTTHGAGRREPGAHRRTVVNMLQTAAYGRVEALPLGACQCGGPISHVRHEVDPGADSGEMTAWHPPVCSTPACMIRKLSHEADYLREPWPWGTYTTIDAVYPGLETQMLGRCECGDMILRLRYRLGGPNRRYTPWFPPFCSTVECLVRVFSDEAGYLRRTGQWTDPDGPHGTR
ncbi:hypothetical protein [Tsukamurella soli]|uniref:Uncharacterized protein n=1 Tax=Tsukamurella soli TaxID=644556 RepID=A0ABP8KJK1_9ACTN